MAIVMLGIPNCSTVKKARDFLTKNKVDFYFRDLKKESLSSDEWKKIISQDKDSLLINTKGPSFRKTNLSKDELNDKNKLIILLENPSVMKRPVVLKNSKIQSIGFTEEMYSKYK